MVISKCLCSINFFWKAVTLPLLVSISHLSWIVPALQSNCNYWQAQQNWERAANLETLSFVKKKMQTPVNSTALRWVPGREQGMLSGAKTVTLPPQSIIKDGKASTTWSYNSLSCPDTHPTRRMLNFSSRGWESNLRTPVTNSRLSLSSPFERCCNLKPLCW